MKTLLVGSLSLIACLGAVVLWHGTASASCEVQTTPRTYANGEFIGGDLCDAAGNKKVTSGTTSSGTGSATAAAPTLVEGSYGYNSYDLSSNLRVTLGTCLSGESACVGTSPNSYIMTTGASVRTVTFSSVTSATSSSVTSVPIGAKTFVAQIINATSETKAATLTIYGNLISSLTGGIAICTITLPSTVTTLQLQDSCPVTSVNFPYYFYTASVYTSASSAPLTVYAME